MLDVNKLLTVLYRVLIQQHCHLYIGVLWMFQVMQDPIPDPIYVQKLFRLLLICVFHLYPL